MKQSLFCFFATASFFFITTVTMGCTEKKNIEKSNDNAINLKTSNGLKQDDGVPPVVAVWVKDLPLFAPFNDGDIFNEGKTLKQDPKKYTHFIVDEKVFDIMYQGEKNKALEHDGSYLNQYEYQSKDEMKGQLFKFVDTKKIEQHMNTHGDMLPEGEIIPREYACGIIIGKDYLKDRTVLPFNATTTEDPNEPQFSKDVIRKVEKTLHTTVEKNRIIYIIGEEEYQLGIMQTKPNDKYGIAAWVLAKDGDITIWTDTCRVDENEHRVYWSDYDPDEYHELGVIAVVKSKDGLDIYCNHMSTDETVNFFLMRQRKAKFMKYRLGSFYQMYE